MLQAVQDGDFSVRLPGDWTGLEGKIEEVNADKEKLRVLISIFGRDTPVELDFVQVEKAT